MLCGLLQCLISQRQRRIMALTLAIVDIFGLPVSLAVLFVGCGLRSLHRDYWAVKGDQMSDYFPLFVIVAAVFSVLTCGFSIKVNLASADWKKVFKNQRFFLIVPLAKLILQAVDFLVMMVLGLKFMTHEANLVKSFSSGFKELMEYYHLNRDYKMLLDRIQVHYMCCGPDSYLEWFKVNWFREEYVTEELNSTVRESFIFNGFLAAPVVPFSCCSVKVMRPCVRWFVEEGYAPTNFNPSMETTLYTKGCGQALTEDIAYWMFVVGKIVLCHSIVKAMNMIFSRYLQTSIQLAIEFADPTQSSPGYLMPFGAPPLPPGAPSDAFDILKRNEMLADLASADDTMDALVGVKLAAMDRYHQEQAYLEKRNNQHQQSGNNDNNAASAPGEVEDEDLLVRLEGRVEKMLKLVDVFDGQLTELRRCAGAGGRDGMDGLTSESW